VVNGQPISREQFLRLLIAGRGQDVLDELVVLELARQAVREAGGDVTAADIQAEEDEALRRLLSQVPAADPATVDPDAARRLLDELLAARGMSREEYRLGLVRNACLRKLATARIRLTEQELRDEYRQAYGPRVQVRHIQLSSPADAERLQQALSGGADFADLARRYSANVVTAPGGGLLRPFSADDPEVPTLLRQTAFALAVGQASSPIRLDNWYHVIRVERTLEPADVPFEQVRSDLESRLRARRLPVEMRAVSAELFARARLEITDPQLQAEFSQRHPRPTTMPGR